VSEEAVERTEKFYDALLREQTFVKIIPRHAWYEEKRWPENKFKMQTYGF